MSNQNNDTLITSMATKTKVFVTSYENQILKGTICNSYFQQEQPFSDICELMVLLDKIYDSLSFPQKFMEYRRFHKPEKDQTTRQVITKTTEEFFSLEEEKIPTFLIHVQFRKDATWQGTVEWVEKSEMQEFRSALELIRLLSDAMDAGNEAEPNRWKSDIPGK